MYNAKIRLFRESLESALAQNGFSHLDTGTTVAGALLFLEDSTSLPNSFFDVGRILRDMSQEKGKTIPEIRQMIVERPRLIFEANGIHIDAKKIKQLGRDNPNMSLEEFAVAAEKPKHATRRGQVGQKARIKMPPDDDIADAFNLRKSETGSYPKMSSGKVMINEINYHWATLIIRFRQEHDETLLAYSKRRAMTLRTTNMFNIANKEPVQPTTPVVPQQHAINAPVKSL